MFSFSRRRRQRREAREWLATAQKVRHFRSDVLGEAALRELDDAAAAVSAALRDPQAQGQGLERAVKHLESVLRRHGGQWYPRRFLNENIEMVLVAAIVAIGIRSFFLQPFKIPTNSMYPTYHGLTHEVWAAPAEAPGLVGRAFRTVAFGARHYEVQAPAAGELVIPVFDPHEPGRVALPGTVRFQLVKGREWLVLPSRLREYTLYVGGEPVTLRVPSDFNLDEVLTERYGQGNGTPPFPEMRGTTVNGLPAIATGLHLPAGEPILSFDILSGDALFVDRMSYHFVRPKPGDPFVFRTGEIAGMQARTGRPVDQYYIKRLAGGPGDTLEIRGPELWRNGAPADGARVFGRNAQLEPRHGGYMPLGRLAEGRTVTLGEAEYFALGDNSGNSEDSRYWGAVPARSVIGRAIFIYYPFTRRWGVAE